MEDEGTRDEIVLFSGTATDSVAGAVILLAPTTYRWIWAFQGSNFRSIYNYTELELLIVYCLGFLILL